MSNHPLPNIKDYRKNLLALTSKKRVQPTMKKTGCGACGKSLPEAKEYARNQVLQSKQMIHQERTTSLINKPNSIIRNINQYNYSNKKNLPFENKLHNNFSFSINF